MKLSTSDLCQLWTINTDCVKEPNLKSKPNLYVLLNIPLLCMVLCFQPRVVADVGHCKYAVDNLTCVFGKKTQNLLLLSTQLTFFRVVNFFWSQEYGLETIMY